MLLPKRTKFRKTQKGRVADTTYRGHEIAFGTYALKAMESGKISNKQIEAARVAFTRFMKREGKVWIRCGMAPNAAISGRRFFCASKRSDG